MNRVDDIFEFDVSRTFNDLYEMANANEDDFMFEFNVSKTFADLYEMSNTNDDDTFKLDVCSTFADLYEMANSNNEFFDIITKKMENEPYLEIIKQGSVTNGKDDFEENKENVAPDKFADHNDSINVYKEICSEKKLKTSKLHKRHLITMDRIGVQLPRTKNCSLITKLEEIKNIPTSNSNIRSVVKSNYRYEHVKSGSKVLKSRNSSLCAFELSSSNNTDDTIENKQIRIYGNCKTIQNNRNQNVNSNTQSSSNKLHIKSQNMKVLNSHGAVIKSNELAHGGVRVFNKQRHTVTKPFSFESRKSCAVKPQNVNNTEKCWTFKARPATVLKIKPFVPKHEKKCTEPKNICFNTERRAQKWIAFEEELKKKISHHEELFRMRQNICKKKEMDLRRKNVHKPEPIKKYKPVLIKKSEKPVTVARSPKFSLRPNINY